MMMEDDLTFSGEHRRQNTNHVSQKCILVKIIIIKTNLPKKRKRLKTKRILKATREKQLVTYQRTPI